METLALPFARRDIVCLETFLRGMETVVGVYALDRLCSPLETFLRGMETGPDGADAAPAGGLETFLRGMETTSVVEENVPPARLETFLRGMETGPDAGQRG